MIVLMMNGTNGSDNAGDVVMMKIGGEWYHHLVKVIVVAVMMVTMIYMVVNGTNIEGRCVRW